MARPLCWPAKGSAQRRGEQRVWSSPRELRGEVQVIDHVGLGVSDLEQSKAFYEQALGPLGYQLLMERDGSAGLGRNGKPDLWIHANRPLSGPTHVAIASPDRATVHAFHAAGLAAGGRDNGPPGLRPTTTRSTSEPSSWIQTATTSRPSATGRHSVTHPPRPHTTSTRHPMPPSGALVGLGTTERPNVGRLKALCPCAKSNSTVCPSCSDSICGSPSHRPPAQAEDPLGGCCSVSDSWVIR
jgi:catechol 2,3-dioxygenase-like lactoylglutathione lyase family enzyme